MAPGNMLSLCLMEGGADTVQVTSVKDWKKILVLCRQHSYKATESGFKDVLKSNPHLHFHLTVGHLLLYWYVPFF